VTQPRCRARRSVDLLIFGLAAFFCFGTIWAHLPRPSPALPPVREQFDPSLQSITSIDAAANYVHSQYTGRDPKALADAADEFVRRRFYHGYSFFGPRQNWLAFLAGYLWIDLRSPVLAEDILDHPQAACSQQVIVFERLARKLGFEIASVRMDHHMVAAVKIGGEWQVYDADREISPRSYPLTKLLSGDPSVVAIYRPVARLIDIRGQAAAHSIRLTDVNASPAHSTA
jgi:hypothetical protein